MGLLNPAECVDSEEIYRHVLRLEGSRNPIDTPDRLDEAAEYIRSEFEKYGLLVNDQEFKVDGFDNAFRNIEGGTRGKDGPVLLVTSHYDTVRNSPGADDNASGVAVMLETARVLAMEKDIGGVHFVAFTLEEDNPVLALKRKEILESLGLTDDKNRFTSAHMHKTMRLLRNSAADVFASGKSAYESLVEARRRHEGQLSQPEADYVTKMVEMYSGFSGPSLIGRDGQIGSSRWVEEAAQTRKSILGVINFEMVGCTSDKDRSQVFPKGLTPGVPPLDFVTHNIGDFGVGNYLFVFGHANSSSLLESFCNHCKSGPVDLSHAALNLQFPFDIIERNLRDVLRSDHAPFWRAAIPALFLTDSAEFRYPYYHTQADTIDKLDFDFMAKVAKATVATALDQSVKRTVGVVSA